MAVTLTHDGETHTIAQWAHLTGLPTYILWGRYQAGWSAARILTLPVGQKPPPRPTRPKPEIAPSLFAPHITGPAILVGGTWLPAQVWLDAMEKERS